MKATVYAEGLLHASALAFDRQGRLWVATSGQADHTADALFVVPSPGARPQQVAGLNGPLGLAWDRDRLYVSEIGLVESFTGLRGDRFALRRTILRGPVRTASNNNLVVAPSGRLVLSVSTTCDHCRPPSRWAATLVSFRPDGSGLRLYARGVRAAFGLAYRPGTHDLFASMNQRDDLGRRTPGDWLAVVKQGDDWGFPACYGQGGTVCAGVRKPVAVLNKHAAAGGVAFLSADRALVAEWQAGKVLEVRLTQHGSTYRGRVATFLRGIQNPLPVISAPDGSVLVGDWATGTTYRIAAG
jgi:glucose/arabinose dehydrogenase